LLADFVAFIQNNIAKKQRLLSPYRFAIDYNISVRDTVKFFMFFSNNDGALTVKYFFECSNPSCISNRIFLEDDVLRQNQDTLNEPIICDECGRDYLLKTIIPFIKVYFQVKSELMVPSEQLDISRFDRNSTFEALEGLPDNLKVESPSSIINKVTTHDEGDEFAVDLQLLIDLNNEIDLKIISDPIDEFLTSISAFVRY
jgi:hypothetical protein